MNKPRITAATAFPPLWALPSPCRRRSPPPRPTCRKIVKDNMMHGAKDHLEKCYGINAVSRNDCAEGAHSCAGQAIRRATPNPSCLLPAGDCAKISGRHAPRRPEPMARDSPLHSLPRQCGRGSIPARSRDRAALPASSQSSPETGLRVGWFEVHAENYFGGGTARRYLQTLRRDYPLSVHGVGLSLGSAEGLDASHLERLSALVRELQPALVSEHLSWSVAGGRYLADLLPLPMTEEALAVVCRHVQQVQERLGRRILIENPSTYVQFAHSSIPEWEFVGAVAARTGCGMLCDVNNIFVSASNHGWDPIRYLDALSPESSARFIWPGMPSVRCPTAGPSASTITAPRSARPCGACTNRRCCASVPGRH